MVVWGFRNSKGANLAVQMLYFQACTSIIFANILLAKASHIANTDGGVEDQIVLDVRI